jgi:hypothetical protein
MALRGARLWLTAELDGLRLQLEKWLRRGPRPQPVAGPVGAPTAPADPHP